MHSTTNNPILVIGIGQQGLANLQQFQSAGIATNFALVTWKTEASDFPTIEVNKSALQSQTSIDQTSTDNLFSVESLKQVSDGFQIIVLVFDATETHSVEVARALAPILKQQKILCLGVVSEATETTLQSLSGSFDTLFPMSDASTPLIQALHSLIDPSSFLTVTVADIFDQLQHQSLGIFGLGKAPSVDQALDALLAPISQTILSRTKSVLISFVSNEDTGLLDISEGADRLDGLLHPDFNVIFNWLPTDMDGVSVSMLATDID